MLQLSMEFETFEGSFNFSALPYTLINTIQWYIWYAHSYVCASAAGIHVGKWGLNC